MTTHSTTVWARVIERRRAVALARHYREAEGLSIRQIAARLGRSPTTVKAYLYDPSDISKGPYARLASRAVARRGQCDNPRMELTGLDALAEMHARDRERGIDPTAIPRVPEPTPAALPQPFRLPPFDTSSFVEPVIAIDPPIVVEDEQALPAKPKPKTAATPNLDKWRAGQMRSDA
jgi:transcriptional regulator with XRE-family HTH domain